jgi:hypothetical protein
MRDKTHPNLDPRGIDQRYRLYALRHHHSPSFSHWHDVVPTADSGNISTRTRSRLSANQHQAPTTIIVMKDEDDLPRERISHMRPELLGIPQRSPLSIPLKCSTPPVRSRLYSLLLLPYLQLPSAPSCRNQGRIGHPTTWKLGLVFAHTPFPPSAVMPIHHQLSLGQTGLNSLPPYRPRTPLR